MNHFITPSSIKVKIAENKSNLINITDVNGLFLMELVGEGVMEESIMESILDGRTRTEINKCFFEWLSEFDDTSVYRIFLSKLREYGQKHIANLLDGTPGELPLSHKVRQHLQKIVRELTQNIDLGSGLLESLQAQGVISEIDCQDIKAEKKPLARAKSLWDVLLRGSDRSFEKFKVEIVKTQPEMMKLIEHQDGSVDKPHVDRLRKHCDVLARCMDVNVLTIAYLQSKGVIDGDMADSLQSTEKLFKKVNQVYNFLLIKSKGFFDSFLNVMKENEQKHVANLLMENSSGQQPLSDGAHKRLVQIKPDLIIGIHNNVCLISAIHGDRENDETDFAISRTDYEMLTEKPLTKTEKNSALIDAVLRRTDYSLKSLEAALRETGQKQMADFLKEGIMPGADLKTTRTDKEEELVDLFNTTIVTIQSSGKLSSDEERQFAEKYHLLASSNMTPIAAKSSNSIMIYSYCKRPADAERYVEYLKSGQLQDIYETMLNLLLKIIEPDNYEPLEAAIILKDEDINILEEFIDESTTAQDKSTCPLPGDLSSSFPVLEDNLVLEDNPVEDFLVLEDSLVWHVQSRGCSYVNEELALQRKKLKEDLRLVGSCRSKRIELKETLEKQHAHFLRQLDESKAAVSKKCEDLKEKVENFKQMLLRDQEKHRKEVEGIMGERIRALESYVSVVSDYEDRLRFLMEHGTSAEICKSFKALHERAGKLLKVPDQPSGSVVEIFQGYPKLYPLIPKHLEERFPVEICEKLVPEQKDFLVEYMDPVAGLLEQLVALRALSGETVAEIRKLSFHRDMSKRLIESIVADGKCQQLVFALESSKQSHLLNYLESRGKYDPKYDHNWPILEPERIHLDSLKDQLPCLLIPVYLNWLQGMNVLNLWHVNLILSKPSLEAKCDAFLEILKRGSRNDFFNVANLLENYQAQSHLKPLVRHKSFLVNCLDPDMCLIDILKPCLSAKEFRSIKSERSPLKRNQKLVDAVSGSNKYDEFISALKETGQGHIANYLNANGVYDQKFAGDWPAVFSTGWEILKRNRKSLVYNLKLLDFLDGLVSSSAISSKQRDSLLQIQSKLQRNEAFVDMLGRGSMENYNRAVAFFHASGQNEVAVWLGRPPEPALAFGHVQLGLQFQVNLERERAELMSAFGEVVVFPQLGL